MTLIQWFNPMTWSTSQVANILAFFSSAGTIGALWYAFHLERKNSKKINDLAMIAKELQRQNRLQAMQMKNSVKPDIACTELGYTGNSTFGLTVLNYGEILKVSRITNHENIDLVLKPIEALPLQFSRHNPIRLVFEPVHQSRFIENCQYRVEIGITDIYNNRYIAVVSGKGVASKLEVTEDEDKEPTTAE